MPLRSGCLSRRALFLFHVLLLAGFPLAEAWAAPPFALSGRAPELADVVVARTPQGPISALDLLIYDDLNDRLLLNVPVETWLAPENADPLQLQTIHEMVQRYAIAERLADQAGAWQPAADVLRPASFGAAEAVWVENTIEPMVEVRPSDVDRYYLSHPELYLQRRQAQVRYIFRSVADMTDSFAREAAREELQGVRNRVIAGEIAFEEAARQVSDAPSAADGGLLPPFVDNTYFPEFEEEAFKLLEPGQMSPVFGGPGGFYLVQLVTRQPPRNVPIEAVRDEIARRLQFEHIASYYNYNLARIQQKRYIRNHSPWFDYMNLDAPLARVDRATLSRQEFFRFYGDPLDPFFLVNWPVVIGGVAGWVEGETVLQELGQAGLADDRLISRARQIAAMDRRAERSLAVSVPPETYATAEIALETLKQNPVFVASMRSVYLVRFTVSPANPQSLTPTELRTAQNTINQIDRRLGEGTLDVQPRPIDLREWRDALVQDLSAQGLTLDDAAAGEAEMSLMTSGANPTEIVIPAPPEPVALAIEGLRESVAATRWQNVIVTVEPFGWRDTVPGSGWDTQFLNVQPGQMSRPARVGLVIERYLVLEERPLDITPWLERPLYLQTLAFQSGSHDLIEATQAELLQQGSVNFLWSDRLPPAPGPAGSPVSAVNPPPAPAEVESLELPPPPVPGTKAPAPQDAPFDIVIEDPDSFEGSTE